MRGSLVYDTTFFIPTFPTARATVNGFGAVFCDVDLDSSTLVELFDASEDYRRQLARFLTALVEFTEMHSPLLVEVERVGMIQGDPRLNLPHFWQYMTVSALLRAAARQGELPPDLDLDYLGEALLAPLHVDTFRFQRHVRGYSTERIAAGLSSLVEALAARD